MSPFKCLFNMYTHITQPIKWPRSAIQVTESCITMLFYEQTREIKIYTNIISINTVDMVTYQKLYKITL